MNKALLSMLTMVLLLAALAPWLLTGCQPGGLVPQQLREERTAYENTVAAAQDATAGAMRQLKSTVQVEVLPGPTLTLPAVTVVPTEHGAGGPASLVVIFTVTPESGSAQQPEATPALAVATAEGALPNEGSATATLAAAPTSPAPATPAGMLDVEDRLSEAQLEEQARQNPDAAGLSGIAISITPDGIVLTARVRLIAGLVQTLRATGSFAVEADTLVVQIDRITLEKRNVTALYHKQVESLIVTGLYQLLPERYVQNFTALPGEVLVQSKVRP